MGQWNQVKSCGTSNVQVSFWVWMGSANEKRRYIVMSSLISWTHTQNDLRFEVWPSWAVTATPPTLSGLMRQLASKDIWAMLSCVSTSDPLLAGLSCGNKKFLHNRPWILPWIKSISNELNITCHVLPSQLSGHCDVIANQLWHHQQNVKRASETRGWCVKILVLPPFMDSLCRVRNKIMYVLLWRTVYALTRVLFWCLFPSLLRNSGNKHQNNPLVSE